MEMLNHHCGVTRDARGVVHVAICNAGPLNILGSAVTNAVREGLQQLAPDRSIRVVVLRGQSEKSMDDAGQKFLLGRKVAVRTCCSFLSVQRLHARPSPPSPGRRLPILDCRDQLNLGKLLVVNISQDPRWNETVDQAPERRRTDVHRR